MKATNYKLVMTIACAISSWLGMPTAYASCPTLDQGSAKNYVADYVQSPDNIGTSWRFYIRPRNGSCLNADQNYQSPKGSKNRTAKVNDGGHNCSDNYKSYISLVVPPAGDIYNTFVNPPIVDNVPKRATTIGFKLAGTKNSGGNGGAIALTPMLDAEGKPINGTVKVVGVCWQ